MKHFKLTPCPNPEHVFNLGRFVFSLRMAKDYWADEHDGIYAQNLFEIAILRQPVDETTYQSIFSLTVHKLNIMVGDCKLRLIQEQEPRR